MGGVGRPRRHIHLDLDAQCLESQNIESTYKAIRECGSGVQDLSQAQRSPEQLESGGLCE